MTRLLLLVPTVLLLIGCPEITINDTPEVEGDEVGECDDGVDNDQDGATDCDDPTCADALVCREVDPADVDDDSDGVTENEGDCDDADPNNFPGNPEICDGRDNDCDSETWADPSEEDGDEDGYLACAECDDAAPYNFPGNPEVCDGRDNDCDPTTSAPGGETDGDSDGALACADCDDSDPESTVPADDADCDGVETDDDCDDSDPELPSSPDDSDCDGYDACSPDGMLTFAGSTCMCCCCGSNSGNAYIRGQVDPALSGAAEATVEFWVKLDDYTQYGSLFTGEPGGNVGFSIFGDCGYGGSRYKVGVGWGGGDVTSLAPAVLGVWTHYAAVFEAGVVAFYLDGVLQGSASASAPVFPNDVFLAGGNVDGGNGNNMHQINGSYRSIRISSTARYAGDFTPPENLVVDAETLHLYGLDEGSGSVVEDSASLVYAGELINNPTWGVYSECPVGSDCDDDDPSVHPLAGDTYGDGMDTDCDGLDCEATTDAATYFAVCAPGLWGDAAATCAGGGYTFGSVRSVDENTLVGDLLTGSTLYQSWPTAGGSVVWLNYTNTSGAWTWGDGYGGPYTNWAPNMPDQSDACAYLDIDGSGGTWPLGSWDDTTCATGSTRALLCTAR